VLLPMHLSKAYIRRPLELYGELAPPPGTRLLRLPDYLTPRPRLLNELPPGAAPGKAYATPFHQERNDV
jgi:hypothetical protein